ncbi:MAG: SpoIID/LytB domain-containing protein, partial [Defluviitaleaceae bacterium]|nr:SpoIID/LytB domain-containing protein [Defluviitaleaceae bacterium]
ARSYAYNQLFTNRYAVYGANVCDSVNSQVYNNIAQTPLSISAVNATSGIFLVYDDMPISANYFSASSGHTANSGEVWARGGEFPSDTPTYLRSVRQHDGAPLDMRVEENARAFFQDMNVRALDMNHPWFRWNTELSAQEIAASVNANLRARYNANPALILTLQPDGSYVSAPIDYIGDLLNIEVTERGEGGNIMRMRLTGSIATILVKTEFNVRSLVQARQFVPGGRDIIVYRHDGTSVASHGMMPSAFYSMMRMTLEDGTLESVRFYGGGSGHGAGMSHAGVRGMTEAGATFEDILRHFYFGAVLEAR